jgi:cytochrome c oxidase subunit I
MNPSDFSLPIPDDARRNLARGWLALGLAALLVSGMCSRCCWCSRARPTCRTFFPWVDFFHTALVVHVDLSVLVWFLAFGGALWSLNSTHAVSGQLGRLALLLAVLGTLVMATAPFLGAGEALMSNYIPVLQHPLFLAGLLVFAAGTGVLVLRAMGAIPPVGQWMQGAAALRFGLNTAAVSAMLALIAFAWSYHRGAASLLHGKPYYELLFWGGGHVLQFTYTLLMLVAWLWLASASHVRLAGEPARGADLFRIRTDRGVLHAGDLPIPTRDLGRAHQAVHLADAVRRQPRHAAAGLALLHGLWRAERAQGDARRCVRH